MQKEFRSKLEDLVENVEELVFPASPGFGGFKLFFGEASVAHPAKANIYLLYYLIKKYTGKGEIVFDPMAGTGSTGILASYLGRHSILVELEEKFYRWMVGWHPCDGWSCDKCHERESKKKDLEAKAEDLKARISSSEDLFEKYKLSRELRDVEDELKGYPWSYPKPGVEHDVPGNVDLLERHGGKNGEIKVIQGDARKLTELLGIKTDSIVTSPPYSEAVKCGVRGALASRKILYGEIEVGCINIGEGYSENPDNIGNLGHGEIDAVITSPPYAESLSSIDDEERRLERTRGQYANCGYLRNKRRKTASHGVGDGYSENPDNIGNLPHGSVDAIITSPPYSEALSVKAGGGSLKNAEGEGLVSDGKFQAQGAPKPYSANLDEAQIGNLRHGEIDAIITSPPYSDSRKATKISQKDLERKIRILEKGAEEGVYRSGGKSYRTPGRLRWLRGWMGEGFSHNRHIGNLPHGEVDAVITSPPYEGSLEGTTRHTRGGIASRDPALAQTGTYATTLSKATKQGVPVGYSPSKDNIGNLKSDDEEYKALEERVDAIITSPPYADSRKQPGRIDLEREVSNMETDTRPDTKNRHTPGRIRAIKSLLSGYSESEGNIGNLPHIKEKGKSETYLVAMLKVYSECYKVLKLGGRMIVILKPFIRGKRVVDLPWHTFLLLERCGFKLVEVLKFRLPQISFWRMLYRRKCDHSKQDGGCKIHGKCKVDDEKLCPGYLPRSKVVEGGVINHEYILVCQK